MAPSERRLRAEMQEGLMLRHAAVATAAIRRTWVMALLRMGVNHIVERGIGRGMVGAEVKNAASESKNGAGGGIVRAAVADAFAANAVLLRGEGEVDGGGGGNVSEGASGGRHGAGPAEKGDIAEAERSVGGARVGRIGGFAGPTEEKETNEGHVTHCLRPRVDGVAVDVLQEL